MDKTHPGRKKRNLFHLFLCHITCKIPASAVSEQNVKEAAVVSDKENRFIRYILFTDHGNFHTGHFQNHFKSPLDNTQRTDVTRMWVEFTDQPFHKENRNRKNQVKN